jgi:gas vesicle protein
MGIAISWMQANTLPPQSTFPEMNASEPLEAGRKPMRPKGRPYKDVPDTRSVSMLGIGMVIGAVVGAGVALLLAPGSGLETRSLISRKAQRLRGNRGVWSKLGRELRKAAETKRKSMEIDAKRKEIRLREAGANPDTTV